MSPRALWAPGWCCSGSQGCHCNACSAQERDSASNVSKDSPGTTGYYSQVFRFRGSYNKTIASSNPIQDLFGNDADTMTAKIDTTLRMLESATVSVIN